MIDWPRKKVADLIDGLTAGVSVRSTDGRGYGPAVLKTSAVDQGRFVPDEAKTILPADRQRARCNPMAGSLIMSRMNTPAMVGDVGYVRNDYPNLFLPDRLWLARPKRGSRADMRWLTYLFASEPGAALLHGLASGTSMSMQSIPKDRVLELEIHTPPPAEQHAIGDALESVDDLIATLERLIDKKQAIKQGMMQQLLAGTTRLPGFTAEWRGTRLGSLGTFLKGRGIKRDDVRLTGVACIRYGEIYTAFGDYTDEACSFVAPAVASTALPLRRGDVLFAGSGETKAEIGMSLAYTGQRHAVAGGDIIVLRGTGFDPVFLASLLNSPAVSVLKARMGQGDAVVHINSHALAGLELKLPGLEEQAAIATAIRDADAEISALAARLTTTRAIKLGMVQQLLTGRIRLPMEVAA